MKEEQKLGYKLYRLAKKYWDEQGQCGSCGHHDSLESYLEYYDGKLWIDPLYLDCSNGEYYIELSCHSDDEYSDNHRGVKIYLADSDLFKVKIEK